MQELSKCFSYSDRPYESITYTVTKGLTPATIATLKALGAIEDADTGAPP
jgi:hypothetical protein